MSWSGRSGSHRITNQMNAICAGRRSSKQHSWHRHSEVSSFWYLAAFCCLEPMFKIIPRWRSSIPCQNLFLNQGFSNSSNIEDEERVDPGLFIYSKMRVLSFFMIYHFLIAAMQGNHAFHIMPRHVQAYWIRLTEHVECGR